MPTPTPDSRRQAHSLMPPSTTSPGQDEINKASILEVAEGILPLELASGPDRSKQKLILIFAGIPGAGKSTQAELVARSVNAPVLHVGAFVRSLTLSEAQRTTIEQSRQDGKLIENVSEIFLKAMDENPSGIVIVDGFPRSEQQSRALLQRAAERGWQLKVVHLHFPHEDESQQARERQVKRYLSRDELVDFGRIDAKISRYLCSDKPAIALLREAGTLICDIPASESITSTNAALHTMLNLSDPLPQWQERLLNQLEQVRKVANVRELMLTGGAVTKAFWNDRFGPPREPVDIDLSAASEVEAESVRRSLTDLFPSIRAVVYDYPSLTRKYYGVTAYDVETAVALTPLIWRQVAIRLDDRGCVLVGTPAGLTDLRCGILRVDESALSTDNSSRAAESVSEALQRARKMITAYPQLKLEGSLAKAYYEQFAPAATSKYESNPLLLLERSRALEAERGGLSNWRVGLKETEVAEAEKLRGYISGLTPQVTTVQIPPKVRLPGALGELQQHKDLYTRELCLPHRAQDDRSVTPTHRRTLPPPQGFESWLHFMAREASDAEWKEWLLDQHRSRHPIGGKDSWLSNLLAGSAYREKLPKTAFTACAVQQKPTHGGVVLSEHLFWSAICLDTTLIDRALARCKVSAAERHSVRSAVRLGVLAHDIGKAAGYSAVATPGVHEIWGARLWTGIVPTWMNSHEQQIASWCIRYHDLLGRLIRGITEKSDPADVRSTPTYSGAYDPTAARAALAELPVPEGVAPLIAEAISNADVTSVPTLAWLGAASNLAVDLMVGKKGSMIEARVPFALREHLLDAFIKHSLLDDELVNHALRLAISAHEGQTRIGGAPVLEEHIFPLAIDVLEAYRHATIHIKRRAVIVALLHDVIDDGGVEPDILIQTFGSDTARIIVTLSEMSKSTQEYFEGVRADPDALRIEVLDRQNNLDCAFKIKDRQELARFVEESIGCVLPMAHHMGHTFAERMTRSLERLSEYY